MVGDTIKTVAVGEKHVLDIDIKFTGNFVIEVSKRSLYIRQAATTTVHTYSRELSSSAKAWR
jgi:hypothetical protein